jgi:hypothetical protein
MGLDRRKSTDWTKRTDGIKQEQEDRLDYTGSSGHIGLYRIKWTDTGRNQQDQEDRQDLQARKD